ncbi:adenylyltransferase/cytidyltransferase family protein [Bacillus timonensis]|nr:adenylyltransferase/cytidyltransferase family protein [Bacillus timonensis]
MSKSFKVGYTTGVFDLFHIGHLNILKKAKEMCDHLIVGVTTDDQVFQVKNKHAVIPFEERIEIVRHLKYVDLAVPEANTDKIEAWRKLQFDVIFKGDDWKGSPTWKRYEREFSALGVEVIYFPYTAGTSSTILTEVLNKIRLNA